MTDTASGIAGIPVSPISENANQVIQKRYSVKDKNGKPTETWNNICWRVVNFVAGAETDGKKQAEFIVRLMEMMGKRIFIPNTPCLVNAGVTSAGLAGCYVLPVPDSIKGIMKAASDAALIHQGGGGTGFSFETLRPEGALVKTTHGIASGPLSFMRIFDTVTEVVKQGGVRRGANMGIMRCDHPDILRFIHAKNNQDQLTNFNISVTITDEFMKAVEDGTWIQTKFQGKDWTEPIYDPFNEPFQVLKNFESEQKRQRGMVYAPTVWQRIVESAHMFAEPGIIFIDTVNRHNLLRASMGDIIATNPCVTGDTRIYTNHGLLPAKQLYNFYRELNVTVDGRRSELQALKSSPVVLTGTRPVFRVQTREGYFVRATADHRIMTNRGWIELQNLKANDKVHILNRTGQFGKEGSAALGRVIGWLVGDGHNTGKLSVLGFWGSEQSVASKFGRDVVEVVKGIGRTDRFYDVSPVEIPTRKSTTVSSQRLRTLVENYGLVEEKLQVPEVVFAGTEAMQRGFLSALFGADGTVIDNIEKGISARLWSVRLELLEQVQQLLLNFGVFSKIYRNRHEAGWRELPDGHGGLKRYWCQSGHELVISKDNARVFAERVGFVIVSKQQRLERALAQLVRGPYSEKFEAVVESVWADGVEDVFDLTQPETESFIANGIVVHNCAEQALHSYNSCNLGSIDVAKFFDGKDFDWNTFKEAVTWSVRFLDNVIDVGDWVLPEIADVVKRTRPVGLGIMGFADLLLKMGVTYGSDQSILVLDGLTYMFQQYAWEASCVLGKEKGAFPEYAKNGTAYDKFLSKVVPLLDGEYVPRNYEVTTIAPTGTISLVAETSSGIEPNFAWSHTRRDTVGVRTYVHPLAAQALKLSEGNGEYSIEQQMLGNSELPDYFVTADDVPAEQHVRVLAAAQAHIDNGVSKTVNAPKTDTVESVDKLYRLAHKLGVKAVSYYRDSSRENQVLTKIGTQNCGSCGAEMLVTDKCKTCTSCGAGECSV